MPHRVVLLVYPGFELLDATGPASVFNGANRARARTGKEPFYAVQVASASGGPVSSSSGVAVQTGSVAELPVEDVGTLLIVGAEAEHVKAAVADAVLRRWVPRCAEAAKRFGSVCSGAFVLAALGLVDGKRVATHWDACTPLAKLFPRVNVDGDMLYVVDGKTWTSAGVSTGIDMALAMVSHDLGAAIAGEVAKRLVLYARRPGYQSQFSPVLQAQVQADNPFGDLIAWAGANLHRSLDVATLAARAGLSERSFHRKFVAATGQTPARFIETLRLDAARLLLLQDLPLKSIAAQVGLSPAARFTEAFERRFGIAPSLFRELHASSTPRNDLHPAGKAAAQR